MCDRNEVKSRQWTSVEQIENVRPAREPPEPFPIIVGHNLDS